MSSRELFISSPRRTWPDASDYVRSLLCAALIDGSVAVQCQSLTSFIIQASSKPSLDMFPRECMYSMRKWLIYAIWSCEALGSLQIDIASPPPN